MMQIRPLTKDDSKTIAGLHYQYLRTNFSGQSGLHLLELYYRAVAHGVGGFGFVAEDFGDMKGFICGVWDSKSLIRCLIYHYFFPLAFWSAVQTISSPKLLLNQLKRFKPARNQVDIGEYELRPIVVSQEARGTGIALKLVERLMEDAKGRGYSKIHLSTEEDNYAAQRLYQKAAFEQVGQFERLGTSYFQFERSLKSQI